MKTETQQKLIKMEIDFDTTLIKLTFEFIAYRIWSIQFKFKIFINQRTRNVTIKMELKLIGIVATAQTK